jgi:phage/plasmid-like protein (TIGR03299 family)
MAHLVETMAYVGETPWHGLGNQLTPKQPLNVWAKQAGMDWQIVESPVCFMTGKAGISVASSRSTITRFCSVPTTRRRSRSSATRYKVVQPREILEFYRDLTEISGFELETAGVLKGGRKVWALARTGQSGALKGDDVTNGYVLLATACDGTLATTAQFTSVRVVCNNTLSIALDGKTMP